MTGVYINLICIFDESLTHISGADISCVHRVANDLQGPIANGC